MITSNTFASTSSNNSSLANFNPPQQQHHQSKDNGKNSSKTDSDFDDDDVDDDDDDILLESTTTAPCVHPNQHNRNSHDAAAVAASETRQSQQQRHHHHHHHHHHPHHSDDDDDDDVDHDDMKDSLADDDDDDDGDHVDLGDLDLDDDENDGVPEVQQQASACHNHKHNHDHNHSNDNTNANTFSKRKSTATPHQSMILAAQHEHKNNANDRVVVVDEDSGSSLSLTDDDNDNNPTSSPDVLSEELDLDDVLMPLASSSPNRGNNNNNNNNSNNAQSNEVKPSPFASSSGSPASSSQSLRKRIPSDASYNEGRSDIFSNSSNGNRNAALTSRFDSILSPIVEPGSNDVSALNNNSSFHSLHLNQNGGEGVGGRRGGGEDEAEAQDHDSSIAAHSPSTPNSGRPRTSSAMTESLNNKNLLSAAELTELLELQQFYDGEVKTLTRGAQIGKGNFGNVYLAKSGTGHVYAVKQVKLSSDNDAATIKACRREVGLMVNLPPHRNCVRYIGSRVSTRHFSIVMEYMRGGTVSACLAQGAPLDEPRAAEIVRDVVTGLAHLHRREIVHQDIKGANVLLSSKGVAKIADFGCARDLSKLTQNAVGGGGTPMWMSPEVCTGALPDRRADIWSLGCLVLEMLNPSHVPWPNFQPGISLFAILYAIGSATQPPPFPDGISDKCRDFLARCLTVDPNDRWTAEQLISECPWISDLGESEYQLSSDTDEDADISDANTKSSKSSNNNNNNNNNDYKNGKHFPTTISPPNAQSHSRRGAAVTARRRQKLQQQQQQQQQRHQQRHEQYQDDDGNRHFRREERRDSAAAVAVAGDPRPNNTAQDDDGMDELDHLLDTTSANRKHENHQDSDRHQQNHVQILVEDDSASQFENHRHNIDSNKNNNNSNSNDNRDIWRGNANSDHFLSADRGMTSDSHDASASSVPSSRHVSMPSSAVTTQQDIPNYFHGKNHNNSNHNIHRSVDYAQGLRLVKDDGSNASSSHPNSAAVSHSHQVVRSALQQQQQQGQLVLMNGLGAMMNASPNSGFQQQISSVAPVFVSCGKGKVVPARTGDLSEVPSVTL